MKNTIYAINCEVSLILIWSENCVIKSKTTRDAIIVTNSPTAKIDNLTGTTIKITDTKLHLPVVTLSIQDDNKLLE